MFGYNKRPPNGQILLVSCSSLKRRTRQPIPAKELYRGTLFRLARKFAETHGFVLYILSAKYGIISGETKIPWYDQKLQKPYDGEWPNGKGYYVGSSLYFGKAPRRFKRLLPQGLRIGEQLAALKKLIATWGEQ